MLGKNHLVTGSAMAVGGMAGLTILSRDEGRLGSVARAVGEFLVPFGGKALLVWIPVVVVAFLVGTLACDVDNEKSMLGRFFHLPLIHRGWTHTDWTWMALAPLAWLDPTRVLAWFVLGLMTHLFLDGLSSAGRVRFYPLSPYKVILRGRTRIVVRPKWRGIYQVGSVQEYVVAAVVTVACLSPVPYAWSDWSTWIVRSVTW